MVNVIRADSAGFCMGVARALRLLDREIAKKDTRFSIATLGPIIHNPQVLADYLKEGVKDINIEEITTEDAIGTLLIRAHGIPQDTEKFLYDTGKNIVDATCPKVKDAQIAIEEAYNQGYAILIYGEANHAEVQGLCSYAPDCVVFESFDEVKEYVYNPDKIYAFASQTTQSIVEFKKIYEWLEENINKNTICINTICDATHLRQEEVSNILHSVEAMVIVGGYTSGNTTRLYEIAKSAGIYSVHVETAEELPLEDLKHFSVIGLSAGASTPKNIIDEIETLLLTL